MNIIIQLVGILGLITKIIGIQLKKKKDILIALMISSTLFAINFFLLKAYSGAVISIVMTLEVVINYIFDKKKKEYPMWLIGTYIIVSVACGIFTYQSITDTLPIIASIIFIFTIIQKKEKNIRLLTLAYVTTFFVYDSLVGAYFALISDLLQDISIIIAILRYDHLNRKEVIYERN